MARFKCTYNPGVKTPGYKHWAPNGLPCCHFRRRFQEVVGTKQKPELASIFLIVKDEKMAVHELQCRKMKNMVGNYMFERKIFSDNKYM
jgi:hypothetical protein